MPSYHVPEPGNRRKSIDYGSTHGPLLCAGDCAPEKLSEFNFDQTAPRPTHRNFMHTVACSVVLACLFNIATAVAGPVTTVRASAAGAKLDSDLLKGGGTDDTRVLQSVLDRAAKG